MNKEALSNLWIEYKTRGTREMKQEERIKRMRNDLRAALSGDEVYENQINRKALCHLCFEYDLYYKDYPEHSYEGLSLYRFFLCVASAGIDSMQWDAWEEELEVEWRREKEESVEDGKI
jgi:hypothetical protein